jgi:hypothetical protein
MNILPAETKTLQDVSGGKPVMLEGVDLPLWGLEVDVEEGRREFAEFSAKNNTADQVRVYGGGGGGFDAGFGDQG